MSEENQNQEAPNGQVPVPTDAEQPAPVGEQPQTVPTTPAPAPVPQAQEPQAQEPQAAPAQVGSATPQQPQPQPQTAPIPQQPQPQPQTAPISAAQQPQTAPMPTAQQPQPQTAPMPAAQQVQAPPFGVAPTAQQAPVGQPYYATPAPNPASGKGTAALVCGILAIVFSASVILGIGLGIAAIVLAGQYVKASGKDGKSTGAKVCGIFGIIFSVLALIIYIAFFALIINVIDQESSSSSSYSYSSGSTEKEPEATPGTDSADEEEAELAVSEALDAIANPDEETIKEIASEYESLFTDDDGFSLASIGIDPLDFAKWITSDIEYTIDSVSVYGNYATAEVTIVSRDVEEFGAIFEEDMEAYMDSEPYGSFGSEDEAMIAVGGIMKESMAKTGTSDQSFSVSLTKKDGEWTVSSSTLDLLKFGIYGV